MTHLFGDQDRLLREVSVEIFSLIRSTDAVSADLDVCYGPSGMKGAQLIVERPSRVRRTTEIDVDVTQLLVDLDGHRDAQGISWTGFAMSVTKDGEVEIDFSYETGETDVDD